MSEPLKNLYDQRLIANLCRQISREYVEFDAEGFSHSVFDEEWDGKELKQRMAHISESLHTFIALDYVDAIQILKSVAPNFSGFEYMFFPGYIELYGLEDYEESIVALEQVTEFSSSEFAVRPFIKKYGLRMMLQMNEWADSSNYHVRRLATEGCRPRLPWAMALPEFKQDPSPVFPILEKLKNDESEFVRRSVANNLNDISKDNPDVVIEVAKNWLGQTKNIDWVVKHGCRTLLKKGQPEIMDLFGFVKPSHIDVEAFMVPSEVKMGESLEFSFMLESAMKNLGKLRIEYAIDFKKKNGSQSRKVFKMSEFESSLSIKKMRKAHSFRKITTRTYYAGAHGVAVIVNGHELCRKEFILN
ncbi:MAG: DNA alkylation repair protein [Pseudomonadales bacterium]|nr:DNA alkylation repair protein [Pseudomonadales bacterium]